MATKKQDKPTLTFKEQKELLELRHKNAEIEHGFRMRELEMVRTTEVMKHERAMERQRIKSAEIRKSLLRKDAYKQH